VAALIDRKTRPEDLERPGHIFPLQAKKGGVLTRAGHTEAAVAGALGVQLGGESFYSGRSSFKPLLGDPAETLNRRHIRQVNVLALTASALAVVLFLGSRLLVEACWRAGASAS